MTRHNGKQVVSLQMDEQDALIFDIIASRQRISRSELLMPMFLDAAIKWQDQLDLEENIPITISGLRQELQNTLEDWAVELERAGKMKENWRSEDLNIRALINASKREVVKGK